ncbi:SMC-Scp complex subunit ScpB [Actinokineospora cianjurensis]|uniref:Segregation and condensation protein B n=1 Tax=Actinokineospora cianjurensis TaxID=585224 RepID=A0A421AYA5_9PSEU|nr:SMC-Scp complex subunit ScpB [Actinokineospora cianjurensis]RLK54774.1 segregation and condensation protein B [Actinokineospora cianjurensis]
MADNDQTETPAVVDDLAVDPTPVDRGAPVAQDAPVDEDAPVDQGVPVAQEAPVDQEAPVAQDAPAGQDVPVDQDAPVGQEPSVGQEASVGQESVPEPVAEEEADTDLVQTGSGFPDLTEDADLESALEAVLLVVDSPAEEELLATATDQPVRRVRETLRRIAARYTEQGSGIDLRRVGEGWRFFTRDRFAPVVEKLLLDGQRAKLTRAALETLAVIAYRQPVTRSRVAAVRGVNVDGVIRTLVVRGLIEETGTDPETGGILYRTTELFLERLGLSSLEDLPPIAPLLPEVDAIDDVN